MSRRRIFAAARFAATVALLGCGEATGPAPDGAWMQVAAGDRFSCALDRAGRAYCWGVGIFGQLGDNATSAEPSPVRVAGDIVFRSLAVGNDHVCGITSAGAAWCWGLNDYGELGMGTSWCNGNVRFIACSRVPIAVGGALTFDSIVVAAYTSCAIASGGVAWCWGWNDHGQLGSGAAVGLAVTTPTRVSGSLAFRAITLDVNHACGVTAGGGLYCWGSNSYGQLAADTLVTPRCGTAPGFYCTPSPIASAAGITLAMVSAGATHTCAIAPPGDTYCWGSNEYGVLGNPAALGGRVPTLVAGGHVFAQLSAGADHSCAVDVAGQAFCWGLDGWGQLGVAAAPTVCPAFGTAELCATSPAAVEHAPAFTSLSAGAGHSCGVTADGEIWCWGRGTEGQLGDGRSASSAAAVRVLHP